MSIDCFCDYDAPEFYLKEVRTARKEHKCYECRGRILLGDRYEHVRGKWDGGIETFKTCQHCVDLKTWTQNNVPCLCWAHGNIQDDCREAIGDACDRSPTETTGLRFGFLKRIVKRDNFNKQRNLSPIEALEGDE
jgi:hypothetical protein